MTAAEFHTAVRGLLNERTFQPFVLELAGGELIHIEAADELVIDPPRFIVRKQTDPSGNGTLDPRRVERVTMLDRLAPRAGELAYSEFRGRLGQLLRAEPFVPFVVGLKDGTELTVDRANRLASNGRHAVLFTRGQPFVVFNNSEVAHITANGEVLCHA